MLAVGDKTDFMKYVELKDLGKDERYIYDWIRNQQNDVYIGAIFKAIASSSAGEAIKKYKLKDAFDKLALKLNNFVHSNGKSYYNFSYQRMNTHSDITKYCKEFGEAIIYITMSFLMVLVLIRPGLVISGRKYWMLMHFLYSKPQVYSTGKQLARSVKMSFQKEEPKTRQSCINASADRSRLSTPCS